MSRWKTVLTNGGESLLASAAGNMLRITRAECGSGYADEQGLKNQTSVSGLEKDMEILQLSSKENISSLRLQLKNEGVAQAFELRQIGIYARLNNDTEDVLYMLLQINPENEADIILGEQDSPNFVYEYLINLIIGGAETLAANVDTAAFVSLSQHNLELDKKVDKLEGKGLSANDFSDADKQKLENAAKSSDFSGGSNSNGYYQHLPNGTLMQWGVIDTSLEGKTKVSGESNFPVPFSVNNQLSIQITPLAGYGGGSDMQWAKLSDSMMPYVTTSFKWTTNAQFIHWFAIGR